MNNAENRRMDKGYDEAIHPNSNLKVAADVDVRQHLDAQSMVVDRGPLTAV